MQNHDFIFSRRSIRKFIKGTIPNKDIKLILEAANHAPMENDYKAWRLVLITDKDLIKKIVDVSANQSWINNASILVVGVMMGDADAKWRIADTAIALENVVLVAESLGYGSCWIGAFNEKDIIKIIGTSDYNSILAYIAIGSKGEKPNKRDYKKLGDIVYFNKYGRRFE